MNKPIGGDGVERPEIIYAGPSKKGITLTEAEADILAEIEELYELAKRLRA